MKDEWIITGVRAVGDGHTIELTLVTVGSAKKKTNIMNILASGDVMGAVNEIKGQDNQWKNIVYVPLDWYRESGLRLFLTVSFEINPSERYSNVK